MTGCPTCGALPIDFLVPGCACGLKTQQERLDALVDAEIARRAKAQADRRAMKILYGSETPTTEGGAK